MPGKKRTLLEAWLKLPDEYCLFFKNPKPLHTWTLPDYPAYPPDSPKTDSESEPHTDKEEDESTFEGHEELLREDGIIYYGSYDATIEIVAVADGMKIGGLTTATDADDLQWLDNIFVDEAWQRRGIGTNLIREAVLMEPSLKIPINADSHQEFYLTPDGDALIQHCLRLGIINYRDNCCASSYYSDHESDDDWSHMPSSPHSP